MFPIDRSLLPSLTTNRALIVLDPQNDFLDEEGALPVKIPMDLPDRIADFATSFRQSGGYVIWACSQFERSRSTLDEVILTSERPGLSRGPDQSRGRRRQMSPQVVQPCECPEAFLTQESSNLPKCVRPGTFGIDVHPIIKAAIGPKDYSLVKTHYSAFKSEQLLRFLRMRLVTELFICGSMTNISVMATAVDAASHGYTITIVDDCCGYQNMMRHRNAIKEIANTTGCEVSKAQDILATHTPKVKGSRRLGDRPGISAAGRYSTVRRAGGEDESTTSLTSEIQSSFEDLSLSHQRAADSSGPEPSAQDLNVPIQPMVTAKESNVELIASKSPKSDDDSPNSHRVDNESVAPNSTCNEESTPHPAPNNDLVSGENAADTSQLLPTTDEKEEAAVSKLDRVKDEETLISAAVAEASDPRPSEESQIDSVKTTNEISSEVSKENSLEQTEEEQAEEPTTDDNTEAKNNKMNSQDAIRESEPLCEGDTKVIYDVLPKPLSDNIFEKIRDEVRWQRMMHQGGEVPRLVAVQGQIEQDGTMPIYRHPSDESPPLLKFSPTILEVKEVVEKQLGHPLNHVLIQFYRDGNDYISEHSDKTLDIVKGSYIANVSLGAERTMTFRTKRQPKSKASADANPSAGPKRQVERARLPHNSLCKVGLKTNMRWLHSIRQDKRLDREKTSEELAYDGGRISLTFRQIGTYLDRDNRLIWGQGATSKIKEEARQVINGQTPEAVMMLQGFGRENQLTEFDWNKYYGNGFDILHISTAPRLFLSSDPVVNMRIQLMLAEYGINYARGNMSPLFHWKETKSGKDVWGVPEELPIKFVDNDLAKTIVEGGVAIMIYIDRVYNRQGQDENRSRRDIAKEYTLFQKGLYLFEKLRAAPNTKAFEAAELNVWEQYAAEGDEFIAGPTMSLADYAFWPVLNAIVRVPGQYDFGVGETGFKNLKKYHDRIAARDSGQKVLVLTARGTRQISDDSNAAAPVSTPHTPTPTPAAI
ncbi:uncharacterized protein GGS25DRAFT_352318 [Hypoxylon fragiforme]|uniref:uncharacterized protein n=1 Tax=Hypoxylon fragiforme TaxID=63214 RepID=UPI0020C5C15D|nr:uncharacterized protein GGS25DRAFT_352318 [Hypoxylon fragiforme]KAI2605697.1 hypothetical protein GGS25DRAFT_352318 [Hypoxylon fragiforme]